MRAACLASVALAALAALLISVPAQAAGGLNAAYERYEIGNGFELRILDVATGTVIPMPPGVNTSADEVHPTLSHDGRYLTFMRTQLVPKLNGDIVPPAERGLFMLDRNAGNVTALSTPGSKSGPVFRVNSASSTGGLSWGVAHTSETTPNCCTKTTVSQYSDFTNGAFGSSVSSDFGAPLTAPAGSSNVTTHAATHTVTDTSFVTGMPQTVRARYLTIATIDGVTGALGSSAAQMTDQRNPPGGIGTDGRFTNFGDAATPGGHPVPRPSDGYVALHRATGSEADIQTLSWPQETQTTVAPSPITTTDAERMPAWSPDSLRLAFARTVGDRRKLLIYDLTPGIQNTLNPPLDMGADAPTPQLRAYQSTWGSLSISAAPPATAPPTLSCTGVCATRIVSTAPGVPLGPVATRVKKAMNIGIFVVRVTGTRKVLGVKLAKIVPVGRVPLGRLRNGKNAFRWNGKVAGKRLRRGTYLLTFRSLAKQRVLSTSDSVRLTVNGRGKVLRAKRERSPLS